jgi:hypothetical protein
MLAIASLSSPHFDANPNSSTSGNVPGFPGSTRRTGVL